VLHNLTNGKKSLLYPVSATLRKTSHKFVLLEFSKLKRIICYWKLTKGINFQHISYR